MKPESNSERMDTNSDPPLSRYDQKLLEVREKCLPLMERLVGKFPKYKKICVTLRENRPNREWLNKLEATCDKIQKKMTEDFFKTLDEKEEEREKEESISNTNTSVEEANFKVANDVNKTRNRMRKRGHSRWDVKPADDDISFIKQEMTNDESRRNILASDVKHTLKNGSKGLTKNERMPEHSNRQKAPKSQLNEEREQDSDVEIIASIAGHNQLKRSKSQTKFVTLEEVQKSPFYKKFTSDNMILDTRAANLKYGTVYDLVGSRVSSGETQHKNYSQRRCEHVSDRPTEIKENWSDRRDHANRQQHHEDKKATLPHKQSHVTSLSNDQAYEKSHSSSSVKCFDRNKKFNEPEWFDANSSKMRHGKSGNQFHGKMPFYKQNISRNYVYSHPKKPFTPQHSKYVLPSSATTYPVSPSSMYPVSPSSMYPVSPSSIYPTSNKTFIANQSLTKTQLNKVKFSEEACSFHCNCCKSIPYFSNLEASYPTRTCVVGNNNHAFFSGQYFQNQPVLSPQNKNLPIPFPTYAVSPLSAAMLAASTPSDSNTNKDDFSVPVFCNEGNMSTNKTTPALVTWNTMNSYRPDLISKNVAENYSRPKDPRSDIIKDKLTLNTSNVSQGLNSIDSSLTKTPCSSRISEERFSKSCTFLRPDHLYRDFKCHFKNNSLDSLKSFGLLNTNSGNLSSEIDSSVRSIISDSEVTSKINNMESNHRKESPDESLSAHLSVNPKDIVNTQINKVKKSLELPSSPNRCNIDFNSIGEVVCKTNYLESEYSIEKTHALELVNQIYKQEDIVNVQDTKVNKSQDNYISPLSNLYNNDSSSKYDGYRNVASKQLENRKRKNYEVLKSNFNNDDNKRRRVGKVIPMAKPCPVEDKEFIKSKRKANSEKISILKIHEINQSCQIKTSPRSEDADLYTEHRQNIKSPTKLFEKDFLPQSLNKNMKKTIAKLDVLAPTKLLNSENTLVFEKVNSFAEGRFIETSAHHKKLKEQTTDYSSFNSPAQVSKNAQVCEKETVIKEDKSSQNKVANKYEKKIIEPTTHLKTNKNKSLLQKEKLLSKAMACEENNLSNTVSMNSEPKNCSFVQPLPHEIISISETSKQLDKETLWEKSIKSISDKKKFNSAVNNDRHLSTEKGVDSKKSRSTNILPVCKNEGDDKITLSVKEKSQRNKGEDFEKLTPETSKNKGKSVKPTVQKSKTLFKEDTSSENLKLSVLSENKDKYKTPKHKGKLLDDQEKSSTKPRQTKNPAKLNHRSITNKEIAQQENSITLEKGLKTSCMSKQTSINISTDNLNPSQTISNEEKGPDRKQNIDDSKDCKVALKIEKSTVIKGNSLYKGKYASKNRVGNQLIPEQIASEHTETFVEKNHNLQMQETCNPENTTKNTSVPQRVQSIERECQDKEEISDYDIDKVRDLVLRMKSLSQSEAFKVITEFASTLKVCELKQRREEGSVYDANDQKVLSDERESNKLTEQITIKRETLDDYPEIVEIEKSTPSNVNYISKTVINTAKMSDSESISKNLPPYSVAQQPWNHCKVEERADKKNKDRGGDRSRVITEMDNGQAPLNTLSGMSSNSTNLTTANIVDKEQIIKKSKFNKKKKLSELDKIQADLESCHGLDDIMKCSGVRTCRLKNDFGGNFKEHTVEDKEIMRIKFEEPEEESFFIEDEITIKEEPIPELNFIKQEQDFE